MRSTLVASLAVLSGEKILITGPAGQIAFPLARHLAHDNEVWGIARFSDAGDAGEGRGARRHHARASTSPTGDFGDLPDDFTYVLHLAAFQGPGSTTTHAITGQRRGHRAAARSTAARRRRRW